METTVMNVAVSQGIWAVLAVFLLTPSFLFFFSTYPITPSTFSFVLTLRFVAQVHLKIIP